jgi:hypothetical protein
MAGQKFEQHNAETEEVRRCSLWAAGQHFGGEIANRTLWSLATSRGSLTTINLMHCLCDAEVGDLCAPLTVNQNVSRRYVTMNDPANVRRSKPTRYLRSDCSGTTRHKWSDTSQHGGEVFTVDKLHHDGR